MRLERLKERIQTSPRNEKGDIHYTSLQQVREMWSENEIVELINRSLYQIWYQSDSHKKYRKERTELEKPVKNAFYELYPHCSYAKCTDEQFQQALELVKQRKNT